MIVKSLELENFRNYGNIALHPAGGINVLYGNNGQGKTNILEAIYLSATTKSHRGSHDKEMIRFSCEESHIKTVLTKHDVDKTIDIHIKKAKSKGIAVNHIPIKRASDLFGILNVVIFAPEDLDIIKNGPSERRRFMDMELCQLDKIYLSDLTNYNKVLKNRSKLLKDMYYNRSLADTLDVWDEQLVKYGNGIIRRRRAFIEDLAPMVEEKYDRISGNAEKLEIRYEPHVSDEAFADEVRRNRDRDIRFEQNGVGPHKDDVSFFVDGNDIRKYGSQGQKRAAALSLKLSEVDFVGSMIHDAPVLLLDDVLSELDKNRQQHLLSNIQGIQTVMTCPDTDEMKNSFFMIDKMFHVENGTIVEE